MAKFSDLGIDSDVIVGKSIDISDLFDKRILIEKIDIQQSKFTGKNASGKCMQMQVCLAEFDCNGNYLRDESGNPEGERRCCFTGSDVLIGTIRKAESQISKLESDGRELYPLDTTIVRIGKCFKFT